MWTKIWSEPFSSLAGSEKHRQLEQHFYNTFQNHRLARSLAESISSKKLVVTITNHDDHILSEDFFLILPGRPLRPIVTLLLFPRPLVFLMMDDEWLVVIPDLEQFPFP